MTRFQRLCAVLVSTAALLAIVGAPAVASSMTEAPTRSTDVSDFSFVSYDADYYLSRDASKHATLKTVETFVAKFPDFNQNRGIIRAIPNDYNGVPLHTSVVGVTNGAGATVPYDTTVENGFTELALGTDDYVHGLQTYQITYTQQNVVRHFSDVNNDELYWDTNGTGFAQSFGSVTARVHVDSSIASLLDGSKACYQGAEKSTTTCEITQTAGTAADGTNAEQIFTAGAENLGPNQTVTVAIGFQSGSFVQVKAVQPPGVPLWSTILATVLAIASIAALLWAVVRRIAFGARDAKGRGIIVPQYSPPKGINLMESAAIISRPGTGIPAQLVSFAVRGNLRILDYPVTADGGEYTLQYLGDTGVDEDERALLTALFGDQLKPGETKAVGVIDDALATAIAAQQAGEGERMISRGYRVKPRVSSGVIALLIVIGLLVLDILVTILTSALNAFSPWMILALAATFVGLFVGSALASQRAVLTDAGAEQRDYLLGVRDYLQLAEADRFRVLQSPQGAERIDVGNTAELVKLYEKMLPFAVLWGIEDHWAKELAVYYDAAQATPDWFVSNNNVFNALIFAQAINGFSSSTIATTTPTPSTWSSSGGGSFSGGSFGGGFSGGGGGGGGGGGR